LKVPEKIVDVANTVVGKSNATIIQSSVSEKDYPLITFFLYAYNQERFIREAVEGAFSQTYMPLEIILSDDCSTDSTFTIMKEMVANYTGPHKIILNRNENNIGVCAHINRSVDMSLGELIVGAAGDDISLPERVTEIFQAWRDSGRIPSLLFSNAVIIDENGTESDLWLPRQLNYAENIDTFKKNRRCWILGCSEAFNKSLFTKYGRIHPDIIQEDGTIAFRALLEGGILYIGKVLVKYRRHSNNVYNPRDPVRHVLLKKKEYAMKKSWLYDAERSNVKDRQLVSILRQEYAKSLLKMAFYSIPLLGVFVERLLNSLRSIRNCMKYLGDKR